MSDGIIYEMVEACGGWREFTERLKRRDGFSFDFPKVPATPNGEIETIAETAE